MVSISNFINNSNAEGVEDFKILNAYLKQVQDIKKIIVEKQYQSKDPNLYNYCVLLEIKILELMKNKNLTKDDIKQLKKELKQLTADALKNANLGFLLKDKKAELEAKKLFVPKWKEGKLLTKIIPERKLKQIRQKFNKAKKVLEKAKTLLKSTRTFVAILQKILATITSPLNAALKTLVDELRRVVDNAKGTGIYVLETFSYSYTGKWGNINLYDKVDLPATMTEDELMRQYLNQNNLVTDRVLENPYGQVSLTKEELSSSNLTIESDVLKWSKYFSYGFKKMTYEDFIELIADAFVDTNDLPTGQSLIAGAGSRLGNENIKTNKFFGNADGQVSVRDGKIYRSVQNLGGNKTSGYFKSGSPKWSEGVTGKVTILAMNFNDFSDLTNSLTGLINFWNSAVLGIAESLKDLTPPENFSKMIKEAAFDISGLNAIKARLEKENNKEKADFTPEMVGEEPNFYGLTFYQLFPIMFNGIEMILGEIESFIESGGKFKLISDLNKLLKSIDDFLRKIENFIDLVEQLINAIESLFKISFQVLSFDFVDGISDIYNKLLEAEGHPYANTGDPLIYLGLVFAYNTSIGTPFDAKKIGEKFKEEQDNTLRDINDEIKGDPDVPKSFKKLMGASGKNITNDLLGGF